MRIITLQGENVERFKSKSLAVKICTVFNNVLFCVEIIFENMLNILYFVDVKF